jgi:hypothetical protein
MGVEIHPTRVVCWIFEKGLKLKGQLSQEALANVGSWGGGAAEIWLNFAAGITPIPIC